MIQVFLSHSSKDKPFVRELADFLEADGLIKVWFDERDISPGENIVGRIAEGLESADFVLLILSPASLSSSWVKEEWTAAFWDQTNQRKTILLGVLYRDCTLPPLLRNKTYFDLRTNQPEGFRAIRAHILAEKPQPPRANHLPVRPPIVVGREPQLAQLRERLSPPGSVVHLAELAGTGKTTLALEFAHRHQRDFESVYWLPCESSNLASIAAELARQLGLQLTGPLPQVLAELKAWCGPKRCLLILDNVESESLGELLPGGVASVLVTTRHTALRFLRGRKPLPVPLFTEAQCFELFRRHIGSAEVDKHHDACRRLFVRLGHLPIAVDIAAALIREDVHFTIAGVAANLPADVTELIRDAIGALDGVSRQLLAAMSACAPEGFFLDLAATIAGLEEQPALDALHQLVSRSLVEELDRTSRRYRLHALVRECGDGTALAQRHAETVRDRFENWETEWRRCEQELPDFELAFRWALENASWVGSLAYSGFSLTERTGRWTEASDICERRRQLAESRNDSDAMQVWLGNQALILRRWGRLDEALALHKKKEAICLELGNKDSLQISYGNQALILQAWGRLDEALALLKKQETICLELGNKDSLQISYGNQALILQAWGRLDEALALLKKQETICLELGNKDSLQRSYGNQALILQDWGRLDEALALHKKKEAICLELGKKDSLQISYGNQALILRDWGRLDEALALHKKEEAICLDLGNKDSLQACYGNQALILQDWGRLDEALALHKKEEAICLDLGNKDGLHACYGNQAVILKAWGRLDEALALHKKEEAICLDLGNKAGLAYSYWSQGLLARARHDSTEEHAKLTAARDLFRELGMPRQLEAVEQELAKTRAADASS